MMSLLFVIMIALLLLISLGQNRKGDYSDN
jgi:hypothetical protein